MMRDAGYPLDESRVKIAIDEKLPFMGYTREDGTDNHHIIVVSGFAVKSGMFIGLLVHEMSHIYRTAAFHPSHDQKIIGGEIGHFLKQGLAKDYEKKTLLDAVNHLEDLYADDIAFKVFRKNDNVIGAPSARDLIAFFQDMVRDRTVRSGNAAKDSWSNASILLDNASALASMKRHNVEDIGSIATRANRRFLAEAGLGVEKEFDYFYKLMIDLREEVSASEFRKLFREYVKRFLSLVEAIR